jgi:hypothetical protein
VQDLIGDPLDLANGHAVVPAGAGLGIADPQEILKGAEVVAD